MKRWMVSIALAGLMLATGGLASGGLKERSASFTAPADELADGVASCKKRQEAVAGGFVAGHEPTSTVYTFASQREGKRDWSYELYSGDDIPATAYVYCDKHEPGLKTRSVTEPLTKSFVSEPVTARCRRGEEAVSGGFAATFTKLLTLGSKRSGKRGWEARFIGPAGSDVSVFAYCDKAEPGLKTKQASTNALEDEITSTEAKCKRKRQLRSGGFEIEYSEATGSAGFVSGSRREGRRRWEVLGSAFQGAPELTAYAYCEKKGRP